jgi:hypothetical protein
MVKTKTIFSHSFLLGVKNGIFWVEIETILLVTVEISSKTLKKNLGCHICLNNIN